MCVCVCVCVCVCEFRNLHLYEMVYSYVKVILLYYNIFCLMDHDGRAPEKNAYAV